MGLALSSISRNVIKELKRRVGPDSTAAGGKNWLTKRPFCRLMSFAVPKNATGDHYLYNLRKKNIC